MKHCRDALVDESICLWCRHPPTLEVFFRVFRQFPCPFLFVLRENSGLFQCFLRCPVVKYGIDRPPAYSEADSYSGSLCQLDERRIL